MPQPRTAKLNEQEAVRTLIDKHRIEICSVLPEWKYPDRYAELFRQIYKVADIKYRSFTVTDRSTESSVTEIKNRARKLRDDASDARSARTNEGTWRVLIERNVMNRFEADLKCLTCGHYLWQSEIEIQLVRSQPSENHRGNRGTRKICKCDEKTRAQQHANLPEPDSKRLFMPCESAPVIHDFDDDEEDGEIPVKKPDLVYGLAMTKSFAKLVAMRQDLRHTPYRSPRNSVLYPFLVIEAKSEKGSPGFEAMEVQTAFPIKTFLKLQSQFNDSSPGSIDPLVWFMGYSGEQWHVYGCVFEGERYRIIDLWQGSIMSYDKALQLLLIVDLICEWAQGYRRIIQRCLSENMQVLREISPASTVVSQRFQSVARDPSVGRDRATNHNRPSEPVQYVIVEDTDMTESTTNNHEAGIACSTDEDVKSAALYDSLGISVICSDSARFEGAIIDLPDQTSALKQSLLALFPRLSIPMSANIIGELLRASNLAMTADAINKMVWLWSGVFVEEDRVEPRKVALCYFRYVPSGRWRATHSLFAITCSSMAVRCLQELGMSPECTSDDSSSWKLSPWETIRTIISSTRRTALGYLTVTQPMSGWPLLLVAKESALDWYETFQWTMERNRTPDPIRCLQRAAERNGSLPFLLYANIETYDPRTFIDDFELHGELKAKLSAEQAVMVSVGDIAHDGSPNFLLLVRYRESGWHTADVAQLLRASLSRPLSEWCSPCRTDDEEKKFSDFCDFCLAVIDD